jgi:formylglycine-generating enzyme required for sulfatase activity
MKTCPICQQAYSDQVEFCARDGARLAAEVREERECPYCAERILKKARVCKYCGRDVEPLTESESAVQIPCPAAPESIVHPPASPPPDRIRVAASSYPPAAAEAPQFEMLSEPRSNMKSFMKSFAVAAVALISIAAGALYFSQHRVKNGQLTVNPNDGLKYVWIPPGTFIMGCSPGDHKCSQLEKPPHKVTITKGFWMGQTEVTVGSYKRFAGATGTRMPPEPKVDGRPLNPAWSNEAMPIVDLTWDEAQAYCSWANVRLPTEAEWEYAARAGSTAARYDDLDEIAWYAENSGRERLNGAATGKNEDQADLMKQLSENENGLHEVGQKHANAFGLFDMLGNVSEWVNDFWEEGYYQNSPSEDPAGPASGQFRTLRGGAWAGLPTDLRVSLRSSRNPSDREFDLGFRCGGEAGKP